MPIYFADEPLLLEDPQGDLGSGSCVPAPGGAAAVRRRRTVPRRRPRGRTARAASRRASAAQLAGPAAAGDQHVLPSGHGRYPLRGDCSWPTARPRGGSSPGWLDRRPGCSCWRTGPAGRKRKSRLTCCPHGWSRRRQRPMIGSYTSCRWSISDTSGNGRTPGCWAPRRGRRDDLIAALASRLGVSLGRRAKCRRPTRGRTRPSGHGPTKCGGPAGRGGGKHRAARW